MHPPLFRPHPMCQDVIQNLIQCHEEHKIGKWFNYCAGAKAELDQCFKKEKEVKRKANMLKAREFDDNFDDYLKRKKEKDAATKAAAAATTSS